MAIASTKPASLTCAFALATGAALVPAHHAAGQTQSQSFVADDGETSVYMHYRPPNLERLAEPDFSRTDLPLFAEMLTLDQAQHLFVETRLHAYLLAFEALVESKMPWPGDGAEVVGLDLNELSGEGESLEGILREALGDRADGSDFEMGGEMRVAIMVGDGGPGMPMRGPGDAADPEGFAEDGVAVTEDVEVTAELGPDGETIPEAQVSIGIQTPDGEELPPEVRAKLEERAREMAERIKAQLEENMASGKVSFDDGMSPMDRIAMHKQRADETAAQAAAFAREKKSLRRAFVQDVHGQLTPEQVDMWPAVERRKLRRDTLPWGELDGEKVDLVRVVDRVELPDARQAALADEVESYEMELHEALLKRNEYFETSDLKLNDALWEGKNDDAIDIVEKGSELRVEVRDVNRRHAEKIAASLDDVAAADFERDVLERSFPRVYRRHPAVRAFDTVRDFDDLDDDVVIGIAELESLYRSELELVDARLRDAIVRYQPKEESMTLQRQVGVIPLDEVLAGGRTHPKIAEAFAKRSQLDQRYLRRLRAMLTPEQAEKIPQIQSSRGGRAQPIMIRETAGTAQ